jgi:hypothetical protein
MRTLAASGCRRSVLLWAAASVVSLALAAAENTAAPDISEAIWKISLANALGAGRALDVYLPGQGPGFGRGYALAPKFNKAAHEADPSSLKRDGATLKGELKITIHPDLWVPADGKSFQCTYVLDGAVGESGVSGQYTGKAGGRDVSGAVSGAMQPKLANYDGQQFELTLEDSLTGSRLAARIMLDFVWRDGAVQSGKAKTHYMTSDTVEGAGLTINDHRLMGAIQPNLPAYPKLKLELDGPILGNMVFGDFRTMDGEQQIKAGRFSGALKPAPQPAAKPEDAIYERLVGDRMEPTAIAELELVGKSPTPDRASLTIYKEALAVYVYKVAKVLRGELKDPTIHVTHWVVKQDVEQPITKTQPGEKLTVQLRPFADVKVIQEVTRSHAAADGAPDVPLFHDVAQKLVLPLPAGSRWNYRVELSNKMPLLFLLKDQLKLVVLGDCQAAFAVRAELFCPDENKDTPVAYNLCQERAGLHFHKMLVDNYLLKLPKLEWVVLVWNPRYDNAVWTAHLANLGEFVHSAGFVHDRLRAEEVWKPREGGPVRLADISNQKDVAAKWGSRPWGWTKSGMRGGRGQAAQVLGMQWKKGYYAFAKDRWELLEQMADALAAREVKFLVATQPYHPETGKQDIKDKSGVAAKDYQGQVDRMRELEKKHPNRFFFYDFNNFGNNGLEDNDFGDFEHPSGAGATKFSTAVERYRQEVEKQIAAQR